MWSYANECGRRNVFPLKTHSDLHITRASSAGDIRNIVVVCHTMRVGTCARVHIKLYGYKSSTLCTVRVRVRCNWSVRRAQFSLWPTYEYATVFYTPSPPPCSFLLAHFVRRFNNSTFLTYTYIRICIFDYFKLQSSWLYTHEKVTSCTLSVRVCWISYDNNNNAYIQW